MSWWVRSEIRTPERKGRVKGDHRGPTTGNRGQRTWKRKRWRNGHGHSA